MGSSRSLAAVFLLAPVACASAASPQAAAPVAAPAPPPPPPACGAVEVEDKSTPPDDARIATVRDAIRQKLFTLQACERPFHVRVNVTVSQVGAGRLQVNLRSVIYKNSGEMVGDIPSKLSAEHTAPEDRAAKEAEILKQGGESVALLFGEHFR